MVATNAIAAGADFSGSVSNTWFLTSQLPTVTCPAGASSTTCLTRASALGGGGLPTAYLQVVPNYDITKLPSDYTQFRAAFLAMMTPCRSLSAACGGAINPMDGNGTGNGHWNWPIWPTDNFGHACWAVYATAYDPTVDCTTVSTLAQ